MNGLMDRLGKNSADPNHPHCHLEIVGFPCNQFGHEEPASNQELRNCLKYVRPGGGFEPNFKLSSKLNVNGAKEDPIYTFLKSRCSSPFGLISDRNDITWAPIRNNDIKWNFAKFLIDHKGQPFRRYTSKTVPENLEDDIKALIEKCKLDGGMPLTQAVAGVGGAAPDPQHDASALTPAATLPISSNETPPASSATQPASPALAPNLAAAPPSPPVVPVDAPAGAAVAAQSSGVNKGASISPEQPASTAGKVVSPHPAKAVDRLNGAASPSSILVDDTIQYTEVRKRRSHPHDQLFY